MNYRLATIMARTAVATDYTEDVDIDVKDPISQLVIVYECTNGAAAQPDGHPAECLTKIELIDGSNVLFSLSGVETQAVDFYHNQKEPANRTRYLGGNTSHVVCNINFGRYLYDPELALNPAQFNNLKLRITIDRSAGGCNSVSGALTVLAHLFDQKAISPIGFFMHKEIKNYTLGNDSHEYTDLPLDFPYRKLFIRAQRDGAMVTGQVDHVKLSEDVDKVVCLNQSSNDIIRSIVSQTRPYREGIIGPGSTAIRYFYGLPSYSVYFAGALWRNAVNGAVVSFYGGNGGYFSEIQTIAGPNWTCVMQGWLPHAVIEIPFGLQNEITDWYDVSGIGNLKLDITAGAAVDTQSCQIMLQQLRRY